MNGFDQLAKGVALSVTRRTALRRFGLGLVGIALAYFAPSSKADPNPPCIPTPDPCGRGNRTDLPHCNLCCSGSYHCDMAENAEEGECFCE